MHLVGCLDRGLGCRRSLGHWLLVGLRRATWARVVLLVATFRLRLGGHHERHGLHHLHHGRAALLANAALALGMLVVAVGASARQAELAIDLWVQVDTLGSVSARREVLASLGRMDERAVDLGTLREEVALNFFGVRTVLFGAVSLRGFFTAEAGESTTDLRVGTAVVTKVSSWQSILFLEAALQISFVRF